MITDRSHPAGDIKVCTKCQDNASNSWHMYRPSKPNIKHDCLNLQSCFGFVWSWTQQYCNNTIIMELKCVFSTISSLLCTNHIIIQSTFVLAFIFSNCTVSISIRHMAPNVSVAPAAALLPPCLPSLPPSLLTSLIPAGHTEAPALNTPRVEEGD